MSNNNKGEVNNDFEISSFELDRMYANLPDEELRRISEDIHATALEVGKAMAILQDRKKARGYDADKTPVDYIE